MQISAPAEATSLSNSQAQFGVAVKMIVNEISINKRLHGREDDMIARDVVDIVPNAKAPPRPLHEASGRIRI
jgi:hypothetical protein